MPEVWSPVNKRYTSDNLLLSIGSEIIHKSLLRIPKVVQAMTAKHPLRNGLKFRQIWHLRFLQYLFPLLHYQHPLHTLTLTVDNRHQKLTIQDLS